MDISYGVFQWKAVLQQNRLTGQTNLQFTVNEVTQEDFALNAPANGWYPEDMQVHPVTIFCDSPQVRDLLVTTELRSVMEGIDDCPDSDKLAEAVASINEKLEGVLKQ